jgi:DNA mismatch repair ATPase MutS
MAFENPADTFPEMATDGALVDATGLAHPLLPHGRAVRNDLALGAPLRLVMLSGSNMSGKSTFLKAVGTNVVLALAGAPTRTTRFRIGPVSLGASLVLRESLLEGRSRFYAEVLRLKAIVARAEAGDPVLFLLDEMLSGTNSHDRAIGARGILEGLIARGAIGIVTTHDLALTEIVKSMGSKALNCHLEDELIDGQLHFDYRIKPGVVQRSNALELMRSIGLTP